MLSSQLFPFVRPFFLSFFEVLFVVHPIPSVVLKHLFGPSNEDGSSLGIERNVGVCQHNLAQPYIPVRPTLLWLGSELARHSTPGNELSSVIININTDKTPCLSPPKYIFLQCLMLHRTFTSTYPWQCIRLHLYLQTPSFSSFLLWIIAHTMRQSISAAWRCQSCSTFALPFLC